MRARYDYWKDTEAGLQEHKPIQHESLWRLDFNGLTWIHFWKSWKIQHASSHPLCDLGCGGTYSQVHVSTCWIHAHSRKSREAYHHSLCCTAVKKTSIQSVPRDTTNSARWCWTGSSTQKYTPVCGNWIPAPAQGIWESRVLAEPFRHQVFIHVHWGWAFFLRNKAFFSRGGSQHTLRSKGSHAQHQQMPCIKCTHMISRWRASWLPCQYLL